MRRCMSALYSRIKLLLGINGETVSGSGSSGWELQGAVAIRKESEKKPHDRPVKPLTFALSLSSLSLSLLSLFSSLSLSFPLSLPLSLLSLPLSLPPPSLSLPSAVTELNR